MTDQKWKNQEGFASLIVGIIIVLVLSLLTVGFAILVRDEQRQTLDKQLSTQAFYAAESGVNDAINYINANMSTYNGTTTCTGAPFFAANHTIDAVTVSSYTCLLVNMPPPNIRY